VRTRANSLLEQHPTQPLPQQSLPEGAAKNRRARQRHEMANRPRIPARILEEASPQRSLFRSLIARLRQRSQPQLPWTQRPKPRLRHHNGQSVLRERHVRPPCPTTPGENALQPRPAHHVQLLSTRGGHINTPTPPNRHPRHARLSHLPLPLAPAQPTHTGPASNLHAPVLRSETSAPQPQQPDAVLNAVPNFPSPRMAQLHGHARAAAAEPSPCPAEHPRRAE
jgi:hypothetical protein